MDAPEVARDHVARPDHRVGREVDTPSAEFPLTALPSAVRPMRLLTTVLPAATAPVMATPAPAFEEIALPQVASGPPIWL